MAMYETLGFCPNNSFLHYQLENEVPAIWERTREILGDRTGYMVYTPNGYVDHEWCYVVDCLIGSTSTLGVRVASKLKELIPNCKYAVTGRKILVTDLTNRESVGSVGQFLEDERYLVNIVEEGDAVHLYFFKKSAE